jgi:hypothetical protein
MRRKTILKWGEVKYWTKPASNEPHDILKFKLDKLRQEVQERLKETVTVYSCDDYTQEELQKLARGEKIERRTK